MSRVTWGDPGTRFFETGVDRGVLYVNNDGVAWTGITSISERASGGEPKPYYMDGIKYLNIAGSEEFEATLEAFAAPAEFGPCDGTQSINNGLFATQQPRKAFGLSYRTLIGNDVVGQNLGYKIHLVYNALAAPSEKQYTTYGESSDPSSLSWSLTTLPPSLTGMKPTAHFVIDSRTTPDGLLEAIEDILYGSPSADSRLPLVSELISMFQSQGPLRRTNSLLNGGYVLGIAAAEMRRNLVLNPSFKNAGTPGTEIRRNAFTDPRISSVASWSAGIATTGVGGATLTATSGAYSPNVTGVAGDYWTVSCDLTAPAGSALTGTIALRPTTASSFGSNAFSGSTFTVPAGTTQRVSNTLVLPAGSDGLRVYVNGLNASNISIDKVMFEKSPTLLPYFDGGTVADLGLTYSWTGTVNASASTAVGIGAYNSIKQYSRAAWKLVGGASDGTDSALAYINSNNISTQSVANGLLIWDHASNGPAIVSGDVVSGKFRARLRNASAALTIRPSLYAYSSAPAGIAFIVTAPDVTLPADGSWVDVVIANPSELVAPANSATARVYVQLVTASGGRQDLIEISNILVEKSRYPGPWFAGDTPTFDGLTYSWTGTANASASIGSGSRPSNWAPATTGRYIWNVPGDGAMLYFPLNLNSSAFSTAYVLPPDTVYTSGATFELPAWAPAPVSVYLAHRTYTSGGVNLGWYQSDTVVLNPGESVRLSVTSTTESTAGQLRVYVNMIGYGYCKVRQVFSGPGTDGSFFDGDTIDANGKFYSWAGAANVSAALLNSWYKN
jgi:hypothetical protein